MRAKAARLALEQRRQSEERAHIKDVIGNWGPPGAPSMDATDVAGYDAWLEGGGSKGYERRLRKTAQRGGMFISVFLLTQLLSCLTLFARRKPRR